jgi:hypothetical protein
MKTRKTHILHSDVEKAVKKVKEKKATGNNVPEDVLFCVRFCSAAFANNLPTMLLKGLETSS